MTADAVIAVSKFTHSEITKRLPKYSEKIIVIPNCIDQEMFFPDPGKPTISGPYLLFVGNLKPHKNLITAIRARKLCRQPDLKLVIAGASTGFITGTGKDLDHFRADPMCIFTGTPDDGELRRLYSHAECLVFPSFYEGFGFPALEAMACGTPVVCSDIPALRETCADAAMYCEPRSPEAFADAIDRVRSDITLREKLRLAGAQRVILHSPISFRDSVLKVLFGG
jgi:glycosyltransferase involved in cell wall biosynthesis